MLFACFFFTGVYLGGEGEGKGEKEGGEEEEKGRERYDKVRRRGRSGGKEGER